MFYGYPKYTYKPLFKRTYKQYINDYIPYIFVAGISVFVTYLIVSKVNVNNDILQIIVNLILVFIIPNVIHVIVFYKTEEFKFYKNIVENILNNLKSIILQK